MEQPGASGADIEKKYRDVQGKARSPVTYWGQQRPPGRVPGFTGAYIIITAHCAFVSGCEGPSISVLCSVASRVAREIQSSYPNLFRGAGPLSKLLSKAVAGGRRAMARMLVRSVSYSTLAGEVDESAATLYRPSPDSSGLRCCGARVIRAIRTPVTAVTRCVETSLGAQPRGEHLLFRTRTRFNNTSPSQLLAPCGIRLGSRHAGRSATGRRSPSQAARAGGRGALSCWCRRHGVVFAISSRRILADEQLVDLCWCDPARRVLVPLENGTSQLG